MLRSQRSGARSMAAAVRQLEHLELADWCQRRVRAGIKVPKGLVSVPDVDFIFLTPTAPVTPVYYNSDAWSGKSRCDIQGQALFSAPLPADYVVPGASKGTTPNAAAAIIRADNATIEQMQPLAHCNATGPYTAWVRFTPVNISGHGITGAHGGSGLSSIGGTIRVHELMPGSGHMRHALKLEFLGSKYFSYIAPNGYRWPANHADICNNNPKPGCTNTSVPELGYGSLLAIPASVSLSGLNLETTPGSELAWTLQNYGGYIVDDAGWDVTQICTEQGPAGDFSDLFKKAWGYSFIQAPNASAFARDMGKIVQLLAVVNNWNNATYQQVRASNGALGAGGGAPLQPWIEEIGGIAPSSTGPAASSTATATTTSAITTITTATTTSAGTSGSTSVSTTDTTATTGTTGTTDTTVGTSTTSSHADASSGPVPIGDATATTSSFTTADTSITGATSGSSTNTATAGNSTGANADSRASKKGNPSSGMIAGLVTGVIVGLLIVGALAFYFLYWRPHHNVSSSAAYE